MELIDYFIVCTKDGRRRKFVVENDEGYYRENTYEVKGKPVVETFEVFTAKATIIELKPKGVK